MILADKVALVTGGASGMGRAGAHRFAREGAKVVVADLNEAGAKEVAEQIVDQGGSAVAVSCDVGTEQDNIAVVRTATETYGGLDIFWANAGIPQAFRRIAEIDPSEFDKLVAINARAPWLGARAALPALQARGGGSFILTASLSGLKGRPDASAYQASKGAATMLVRSLAKEFGPYGIRVNSVCPIASETPMWAQFMNGYMEPDNAANTFAQGIPLGRLAEPEDVANAALFFAGPDSAYISGVNLPVDGGSSA
ncbi:SDR family oxidoreductase [Sciscionella marina]|uniref:SDR family oxidoreductase n=1 Tax=Sciscionella marina TaxID=508770 RepID=UPI00039A7284|nr:SDR family oxidoreductase [Sciscionella marina]